MGEIIFWNRKFFRGFGVSYLGFLISGGVNHKRQTSRVYGFHRYCCFAVKLFFVSCAQDSGKTVILALATPAMNFSNF